MDIEKLIEQLNARGLSNGSSLGYHCGLYDDAATALSTLQGENEQLREERDQARTDCAVAEKNHADCAEELEKRQSLFEDVIGDMPVDRLRELVQADREGRCVVLPCKKGDTVWRIVHDATPHITKDRCTNIKVENKEVWVNLIGDRVMGGWNFGKLLFLNEKEAEVALKAREQDG